MKSRSSRCLTIVITSLALSPSLTFAAISLSANVEVTQNFDMLASSGTSTTMPLHWSISEVGSGSPNSSYAAGTGSGTTGDTYSFGATGSSDRALGGLQSGTLNPTFGAVFQNNTGSPTINLFISYVGEQWRLGAIDRQDRLEFSYSLNATNLTDGSWTSVAALHFLAPIVSGTTGSLDGNLSANRTLVSSTINALAIEQGGTFRIRWTDFNASGSDDGLAVDDFKITAVPEPAAALLGSVGLLGLMRRRR